MSALRGARGAGGGGGDRVRSGRGNRAPTRGAAWRGRDNGSTVHDSSERTVYTPRGPAAQRGQRDALPQDGDSQTGRGDSQGRGITTNAYDANPTGTLNTTPYAQDDYQQRLNHIKDARPALRQRFIRDKLMNPEGQMKIEDYVRLFGICTDMCPEFERVRRIVESDVKPPECTPETEHLPRAQRIPDESRMVKAYGRSAAGMDVELVSEIRSPATCLKTIEYLFQRLDNEDFEYLQSWIWDRARAVRKDLRTQCIQSRSDINILLTCIEQTTRFHLLSMHQMARSTRADYSHQQDFEQFNQNAISLKERYRDNRRAGIPSENEAEFFAYQLILAPQYADNQLEFDIARLSSDLQNNKRIKTAIELFRVMDSVLVHRSQYFLQCQANWKKFWDLVKSPSVSYLMACAAEVSFNQVRHVVLDALWRGYRRGNAHRMVPVEDWTPEKLKDVLGFDTEDEAAKLCEDYRFVWAFDSTGKRYLDITYRGYAHQSLVIPPGLKPQFFSARMVEIKRHKRAFSAIIQEPEDEEDSLFVPESLTANTNTFSSNQQPHTSTSTTLTPIVPPLQPTSITPAAAAAAAANPFLRAASQLNATPALSTGATIGETTKSVLDSTNPFLKKANAPPTPQSNPFASFAAQKPKEPTTTKNSQPATPTPQDSTQFGVFFTPSGPPPQEPTASKDAERQKAEQEKREANEKQQREEEAKRRAQEALRARAAQDAEHRRKQAEIDAEQQRQQAAAAAERQRQLQLQKDRERQAKEEQERRIRELQQRQAQEEEARHARLRERESALHSLTTDVLFDPEQGLMMQFLENEALNIAQQVMIEEEWTRKKELANEMFKHKQMMLERAALAKIVTYVEKKRRDKHVRERRKRLRAQRAQMANMEEVGDQHGISTSNGTETVNDQPNGDAVLQRPEASTNVRRAKRTEERRGRQVAHQNGVSGQDARSKKATQTAAVQAGSTPVNGINGNTSVIGNTNGNTSVNGYSHAYHRSTAPIDRTETDWFKLRAMGIDPSKHRKRSFDSVSDEGEEGNIGPKRPKLSPPQKNTSYELPPPTTTADDQMARFRAVQQAFRKTATSPPQAINGAGLVNGHSSLNGSSSNLIAKAQELGANPPTPQSAAPPVQSINGAMPAGRASSFDAKSSLLIAKARDLVANAPMSQTSPPNVQHDWGRSVPHLGHSGSSDTQSTFNKGIGVANINDRPAYWSRASRFVPRHLYGKGAEAVRAYREQLRKKSHSGSTRTTSPEPFAQSSPIPTQQSYVPQQGYTQEGYTQQQSSEENDDIEVIDANAEDLDSVMAEEEEEDSVMTEEEDENEHQYGDYNHQAPPPYSGRYLSQSGYQDEDSETEDTEEEIEEEETFVSTRYVQAQVHVEQEEVYEDYDEYMEEDDDEEEGDDEADSEHLFAQPAPQLFGQHATMLQQHSVKPALGQPLNQAGTTEDDAIELSD